MGSQLAAPEFIGGPEERIGRHEAVRQAALTWSALSAVAAIPASVAVGYVAQRLFAAALPGQGLSELRGSNLAFLGGTKSGELLYPLICIVGPLLVGATVLRGTIRVGRRGQSQLAVLSGLALIFFIPALLSDRRVAGLTDPMALLPTPISEFPAGPLGMVLLLQSGPFLVWGWLRWFARRGQSVVPALPCVLWSASLGLSALGCATVVRAVAAPLTIPPVLSWLLISALLASSAALYSRSLVLSAGGSPWLLTLSSSIGAITCLPLLWPPQLVINGQTGWPPGVDDRVWKAFTLGVAAIVLVHAVHRSRGQQQGWSGAVSSLSIAAVLVPLRIPAGVPVVNPDDYHFGERFSPAILWQQFGQVPYTDQDVVRGFLPNYVPQLLNGPFGHGLAATFDYVYPAVALLSTAVAVTMLRPVMGVAMATAAAGSIALANSNLEADLFTVAVLLLILLALVSRWRLASRQVDREV